MIFLSYRVADAAHLVGRLRDALIATYGTDAVVFRDKTGLAGGDDWGKKLLAEVEARPIFLPVIGPGWADARFTDGAKQGELRLDDPDDWVRKEIRTALDVAGKVIVPLRMDETKLRSKEWLTRRGLGELAGIQGLPVCDDPRYQDDFRRLTELLEEKHPALKTLRESRHHRPPPASLPGSPLPAKPPVCVGRDDILRRLESLFLPTDPNAPLPRLAIAGVGGIGKSTAVLWFLHDDRVKARYGDNRHFVPLAGADSRAGVVAKLAEYLGLEPGPNLEPRVLTALDQGERRLLVLDNAETPLQSNDGPHVQDLLGTLAHFAKVGLVATLRPETHLPNWDTPDCLAQLTAPHDLEAFHKHTGRKFASDREVAGFVAALDGWPLVLRLAAEQANGYRTLRDFRAVWERKKAELLAKGADRGTNLAISVGLSLDAVRKENASGLRLLAGLARLPDGLLHEDVTAVLGEDGVEAVAAVRKVGGLMSEDAERMRMLAPLREHLRPLLPWADADREQAIRFFCEVAGEGEKVGTSAAQGAIARLSPRAGACVAMTDLSLAAVDRSPAYKAARGLGKYGRFVGLDFSEPLRRATEVARTHGDTAAAANCLQRLGDIALDRSDHTEARACFEQALPLFQQVGHVLGEATCIEGLGDIALARSDHPGARARYEQALPLFRQIDSVLGQANCVLSLGDIARDRADFADARGRYEQALPLFRKIGSALGEANCIQGLADVALAQSDYAGARGRYEEALPLFRRVGGVLGEACCIQGLGDSAHAEGDPATARTRWQAALQLFQRVEEPFSIGGAFRRLARVTTDPAERVQLVSSARAAWGVIDRPDLVAELDKEFPPEAATG